MIPAPFEYVRAGSAEEAVATLAEHGDEAKLLAGGMSLLPLMKLRLATPAMLIDVGRVGELSYVRDAGDHLEVGALTRHRDLETSELLAAQCAPLRTVAAEVGDNQVRHRGTIGGSASHGDPASDLPALLLALDAVFMIRGPASERTVSATEFFRGFLETALEPDELLTEIRVPKTPGLFTVKVEPCMSADVSLLERARLTRSLIARAIPARLSESALWMTGTMRFWFRATEMPIWIGLCSAMVPSSLQEELR